MPPKELPLIDPDLQQASDTGIRLLFSKMQTLLEGKSFRLFSKNLMNGRIHFTFYILPFDTAHLEMVSRWGKKRFYIARIQDAVNKLAQEGVSHISLGAHASIVTGNGLFLSQPGNVKILTGNTLTVASALYHAESYFNDFLETYGHPATIAIVGANGNIGSGLAACFDEPKYHDAKIILAGNNLKKLELLRNKVFGPYQQVTGTTDLFRLQDADIIISCTNTNDPLIFPHHIAAGKKVFIIDLAVPGSVADEVKRLPQVQFCRDASTVFMHHEPDFLISTHTPKGKVFCCAGEVMLAALHDVELPLRGQVHPDSIKAMMQLGKEEGIFKTNAYETLV
jgi:predicted amino acid dehydrogenase